MSTGRHLEPVSERMERLFGPFVQGPDRLNLGTARNHEPGFLSLDVSPNVDADVRWNLEHTPLPFSTNSFDVVLGTHVFEHIRYFVPLVRDLHRIVKPGGYLISVTPYISSDDALDNPFHVRAFSEFTWGYFNQQLYATPDHAGYGDFGIDFTWNIVQTMLVPRPEYRRGSRPLVPRAPPPEHRPRDSRGHAKGGGMSGAALSQVCQFDFMRCEKCGRLVTKPEIVRALENGTGQPCPCGGMKLQPMNLPWWGWLLPRVWAFAWERIRSQNIRETLRREPAGPEHDNHAHADDELEQLPERRR